MKYLLIFIFSVVSICAEAGFYRLFEENGKVGIKNDQGKVVIPPSFEALGWSDGNFSVISEVTGFRLNNKWGLINLKKEFVTQAIYENLTYAGGDYVVVRKRLNPAMTKAGCINLRGEIKLPFSYDGMQIQGLRAIVFNLLGAKFSYGLADLENNILIPISYKHIYALGTLRYAVENAEGKIALFDDYGKSLSDFRIDSLSSFNQGLSIVYENGLQGLIDRNGETKLNALYRSIKITEDGKILTQLPSEWAYLTDKNEIISKLVADELIPTKSNLIIIESNGRFGLVDSNDKIVLPIKFEKLRELTPKKFQAQANGKQGIIEVDGKIIVPFEFDSIRYEQHNVLALFKYRGWQLLDSTGKTKSKKRYDFIGELDGNSFKVKTNGHWGLLSLAGDEVIHCVFDSIIERKATLVAVRFKGQYGIMDMNENWRVAPQPFPIQLVNDQRYLLRKPDNAFLKSFEHQIIYFTPHHIEFREEYFIEHLPDGTEKSISYEGLILKRTSFPILKTNDEKFVVSEGFRGIKIDGKYGFVDGRGNLRVANRYDSIDNFHEGLAPIKLIGKWGFINPQDKIVIHPNYESVTQFVNNLSIAKRNGKYGLIDKSGMIQLIMRYDNIQLLSNQKFLLTLNKLKGIANEKGQVEIEPRFEFLEDLKNGFLITGRAGKFGLITTAGLDRIPMIYDKLIFDQSKNQYLAMRKNEWREVR
jgi:WG containing repeat